MDKIPAERAIIFVIRGLWSTLVVCRMLAILNMLMLRTRHRHLMMAMRIPPAHQHGLEQHKGCEESGE